MNRSGEVLPGLLGRFKIAESNLLVVCDTLDLPVGRARIKRAGSSAGHGGLKSIITHLGSENFARCYIGIGRPSSGKVIDYVLTTPSQSESAEIDRCLIQASEAIDIISRDGIEAGLQRFNNACS